MITYCSSHGAQCVFFTSYKFYSVHFAMNNFHDQPYGIFMNKKILLLFLSFLSLNLYASFVASNNSTLYADRPTHILIAGNADKLGNLFIYSLLTRANIYLEKSSNEQIIIIGRSDDKELVKKAGFKILHNQHALLKSGSIQSAISNINIISSIDIYAHSNPVGGATLDSNSWVYQLLNENDDLWNSIQGKLIAESFIFIHGCNAGIKLAPALAIKLKIAVFAALTSTDFQHIYKGNFWSFDYDSEKNSKANSNSLNYSKEKECDRYCTRMRPDNFSYQGHWGDWTAGGYPAYKLFCGSNTNEKCERGALEAIFTFPSEIKYENSKSNLINFKKQLIEFMCPFSFNLEKQNDCRLNLESALNSKEHSTYTPFDGKTLVCDRVRCKAHFICSKMNTAFNSNNCSLESETNEKSTTFADEFKFLIESYTKYYKK